MYIHVKKKLKILLVDDNESIVNMLNKFLTLKGHNCTTCFDGKNALSIMMNEMFDAVLLDLAMPEFSGYDVICELEKTNRIQMQNIIVLTASIISKDLENSLLKQGIKICLRKPVTPEILLRTIESIH